MAAHAAAAMRPTIRAAAIDAAKLLVQSGDLFQAAYAAELHRPRFESVMEPQWKRLIQAGIDFELDWERSSGLLEQSWRPKGIADASVAFLASIRAWVAQRSVASWRRATRWLLRHLNRIWTAGAGQPASVLGPKLTDSAEGMGFIARLMALMETTYALNTGGHHVRIEMEIGSKIWLAQVDEKTRQGPRYNHVIANGQQRPLASAFIVSGESLLFPGDETLGATGPNIFGCRCLAVGSRFR